MKIDKNTFGNTPAAIYLADRINFLDDKKYLRKISSIIHGVQSTMADTLNAHEQGVLDIKTVNFVANRLREKVTSAANELRNVQPYVGSGGHNMPDELSIDLMSNVLIGELKSVARRTRNVKLGKYRQAKEILETKSKLEAMILASYDPTSTVNIGFSPKTITIGSFNDDKTPDELIKRSLKKLKRRGKKSTLY